MYECERTYSILIHCMVQPASHKCFLCYLSANPLNGTCENRRTVYKLLENVDVLTTGS
jgi:hypothetical protein